MIARKAPAVNRRPRRSARGAVNTTVMFVDERRIRTISRRVRGASTVSAAGDGGTSGWGCSLTWAILRILTGAPIPGSALHPELLAAHAVSDGTGSGALALDACSICAFGRSSKATMSDEGALRWSSAAARALGMSYICRPGDGAFAQGVLI